MEEYKKDYNLTLYTNPHISENQSKGEWKPCAICGISLPIVARLCWSKLCYAPQNTQGMDDWKRLLSTHGAGHDDAMRMFTHMFQNENLGVQRPTKEARRAKAMATRSERDASNSPEPRNVQQRYGRMSFDQKLEEDRKLKRKIAKRSTRIWCDSLSAIISQTKNDLGLAKTLAPIRCTTVAHSTSHSP